MSTNLHEYDQYWHVHVFIKSHIVNRWFSFKFTQPKQYYRIKSRL